MVAGTGQTLVLDAWTFSVSDCPNFVYEVTNDDSPDYTALDAALLTFDSGTITLTS